MRRALPYVIVGLAVGELVNVYLDHPRTPDLRCATIHRPHRGCPTGYVETPYTYYERRGRLRRACADVTGTKEVCVELRPGETVHVGIPLPTAPPMGADVAISTTRGT